MNRSVSQFTLSIIFIAVLCVLIGASETDLWAGIFIGTFIFVGLPILILSWIEFGDYLRNLNNAPLIVRLIGFLFGVPQALFGIVCMLIGASIILWILYNTLIERQAEFTGSFMSLGLSPMFIAFGLFLLISAFKYYRVKS